MRVLEGEQQLVRIFVDNTDKWGRKPLYAAIIDRLRREGFAGATAIEGMMGFGAHSVVHSPRIFDMPWNLPVVIEVVDTPEQIEKRLLPIVDEMVPEGLVTIEKVRVLKYAPGTPEPDASAGGRKKKR